jgi:hypothetical protein
MGRDSLVRGIAVFFVRRTDQRHTLFKASDPPRPTEKGMISGKVERFPTTSGGWPSEAQGLGFFGTT